MCELCDHPEATYLGTLGNSPYYKCRGCGNQFVGEPWPEEEDEEDEDCDDDDDGCFSSDAEADEQCVSGDEF